MVRERLRHGFPGIPLAPGPLPLLDILIAGGARRLRPGNYLLAIVLVITFIAVPVVAPVLKGFFIVGPNEAKVLQLFGSYVGTAKDPGLRWANPFFKKTKMSLRVRNFESANSR